MGINTGHKTRMQKEIYGLIGSGIQYSRSPEIFRKLWDEAGLQQKEYRLLDTADLADAIAEITQEEGWRGVSVTIPYKEAVLPYLDRLTERAEAVGAVNAIRIEEGGRLIGDNTDVAGFLTPLRPYFHADSLHHALLLGSGGAAKAVAYALQTKGVKVTLVSRQEGAGRITYEQLHDERALLPTIDLVVNATPLGGPKYPQEIPPLPYDQLRKQIILYDLNYAGPLLFLQQHPSATTIDGLPMLHAQAVEALAFFTGSNV